MDSGFVPTSLDAAPVEGLRPSHRGVVGLGPWCRLLGWSWLVPAAQLPTAQLPSGPCWLRVGEWCWELYLSGSLALRVEPPAVSA